MGYNNANLVSIALLSHMKSELEVLDFEMNKDITFMVKIGYNSVKHKYSLGFNEFEKIIQRTNFTDYLCIECYQSKHYAGFTYNPTISKGV